MILVRSPLRITLGGGDTDLPAYYRQHGGFLIAAAIDKYVYVSVLRPFSPGIYLKYSQIERVATVAEVQHSIMRETLRAMYLRTPQVEITTLADIPAETGLGSSGSFTTALIKALYTHHHQLLSTAELAELACEIEINKLGAPIGKQDQYSAAYGGVTCFTYRRTDRVEATPLKATRDTLNRLEDNLLLFFTGFSRQANTVLTDQRTRLGQSESTILANLHLAKTLAQESRARLESGETQAFGRLLHEQWTAKKARCPHATNPTIDGLYQAGLDNGAIGGKLVGAGGGGFLLFYTDDPQRLRTAMKTINLEEVRFRFDYEGTKVLLS